MTWIPNCRNDEYYNEKNLNAKDKEFVDGYDWCVEMAVDAFFDNMDIYDGTIGDFLDKELPEELKNEYEVEYKYPIDDEINGEVRRVETYKDLVRCEILDYIEMHRNELIVSMLDNYEDDYGQGEEVDR